MTRPNPPCRCGHELAEHRDGEQCFARGCRCQGYEATRRRAGTGRHHDSPRQPLLFGGESVADLSRQGRASELVRQPPPPDHDTLAQARRDLLENRFEGTSCQCCGRHYQTYKRSIRGANAAALAWLVRRSLEQVRDGAERWVENWHVDCPYLAKSKAHGELRHWGLIERKPREDETPGRPRKRFSGIWAPVLPRARDFVDGRLAVPRWIWVDSGDRVVDHSEETTTWAECLGDAFDLSETMRWLADGASV